jgi:hypothetical protein
VIQRPSCADPGIRGTLTPALRVGIARRDHLLEEKLDRTTAGLGKQEGEKSVNEATDGGSGHRGTEPQGSAHVLEIGFADGFWMITE